MSPPRRPPPALHLRPAALGWVALLLCGFGTSACWDVPNPLAPTLSGPVGVPHHGVLTAGHALDPKGQGYQRLRRDDVRWGTPRLVTALRDASAAVDRQRPGAAPLVVADLSGRRGGRIPRHRSHRTGRDVDLLFYVTTPTGRSIENPGFVHFGRDSLAKTDGAGRFVQLDVPRQWLLIKALLNDPQAQVQWLFIARWLEALLIEYAQARGEPQELILRAERTLHQPSDSASHDDHIHMRLACTPSERAKGCWDRGPRWPWLPVAPSTCPLSDDQLLQALLVD